MTPRSDSAPAADAGRDEARDETRAGSGAPIRRSPWRPLVLLAAAQAMVALDVTVVNVALPAIGADLRFGPGDLQWVVSVYVLVTGGLLLLGGRLSDLIGPRPAFFAGLALFVLASLTSGIAQASVVLVVSRAVQGLGAALLSPAALSLITRTYSGAQRATALGAWGAIASGGGAAGLLVGGALTTWLDWRWAFFVNVPVGVVVLVAGIWLVPRAARAPRAERQRLDIAGAVVGSAGLAVTVYGIGGAAGHGWGPVRTVSFLGGGVALLLVFAVVERYAARPLVPPALWKERSLAASTIGIFVATIALVGALFLGAFLLEASLGASPLRTGVALLPMVVAIAFAAHLGGVVVGRLGAKYASTVGLVVAAMGASLLSLVSEHANYAADLLPGLVLLGFGLGLCFVVCSVTSMADIPPDRAGSASGLYMTAHDIGGAFGVAVLSTIAAGATSAPNALQTIAGQQRAWVAAAAITAAGALLAALTMPSYRPPAEGGRRFGHGALR